MKPKVAAWGVACWQGQVESPVLPRVGCLRTPRGASGQDPGTGLAPPCALRLRPPRALGNGPTGFGIRRNNGLEETESRASGNSGDWGWRGGGRRVPRACPGLGEGGLPGARTRCHRDRDREEPRGRRARAGGRGAPRGTQSCRVCACRAGQRRSGHVGTSPRLPSPATPGHPFLLCVHLVPHPTPPLPPRTVRTGAVREHRHTSLHPFPRPLSAAPRTGSRRPAAQTQ